MVARWALAVSAVLTAAVTTVVTAPTAAADDHGPALTVSHQSLAENLHCHGDLSRGTPVLLIHGTFLDARTNFDWNYEPALEDIGRAYCSVNMPGYGLRDIQINAEYVVYAIRAMHQRAGHRIDLVGFSQGGMVGRWALKYWPDTREDVDDYVGIDGSNHGTLDAYPVCTIGCAPAVWQQQTGSRFLATLNEGAETFAGISYTEVFTLTDEVVVPNLPPAASSSLHTGDGLISNIPVQSICPAHLADHLSMGSIDPVAWAVVVDAIDHSGPARASRIDPWICTQALMPGVNPLTLPLNEARFNGEVARTLATFPHVSAEPATAPYARDRS
jgi:pimeloyl-ACP methyl ester carboxylesterase